LRWGFAELRLVGRERDVEHDMVIPLTGVPLAERVFFMHTTWGSPLPTNSARRRLSARR